MNRDKLAENTETQEMTEEVTEIIELACDDLEVLTRAFNLISEICNVIDEPKAKLLE